VTGPHIRTCHCLERTFIIDDTLPIGVQFSHPVAEQVRSNTSVSHMAHDGLFREPAFADGTQHPSDGEQAPIHDKHDAQTRSRRTTRHRRAA
jgi:hypothetical protein